MEEILNQVIETLKYAIPSAIVFATAYLMLKQFFNDRREIELMKAKMEAKSSVTPTKLQAYERLILLLERIEPTNLIARVYQPAMSSQILKRTLLKTVRDEYEHNLAQQLYVSNESWKNVGASKEAVLQLINLASDKVADTANGSELINVLFEIVSKAGVSPTEGSIEQLKNEARQLL